MRPVHSLALLFLFAFATSANAAAPPSAAILLRVHPAAWRLPARLAPAAHGMTIAPETGEPAAPVAAPGSRAAALAKVIIRTDADGSRHAVLAGAIRAYSVVHIDAHGTLVEECVHSEEEAIRRVKATAAEAPTALPKPEGH